MNKYIVNEYLPKAYTAIHKIKNEVKTDVKRSDFSAFGATIIMSGLYPAISAYSKDSRKYVLDTIDKVLATSDRLKEYYNEDSMTSDQLHKYCNNNNDRLIPENVLKEEIIDAVIAIKLVLDAQ